MNRLGLGLASIGLLAAAGCGGGSDEAGPATTPSRTPPPAVSLADTCPQIQEAFDRSAVGKKVMTMPQQYVSFAEDIRSLTGQADKKAVAILQELSDQSDATADALGDTKSGTERLEAATDWLATYKRVADACQAVGAPIRLAR